ncbi:MAG: IS630 transposase-related protein, partial [Cyanobacteria bacterium J06600_6]
MSAKTDKQKKVIDILVTGSTLVEASKVTKIPLSTIQRWSSRDLEFVRALRVALRKYTLLNLLASVPH